LRKNCKKDRVVGRNFPPNPQKGPQEEILFRRQRKSKGPGEKRPPQKKVKKKGALPPKADGVYGGKQERPPSSEGGSENASAGALLKSEKTIFEKHLNKNQLRSKGGGGPSGKFSFSTRKIQMSPPHIAGNQFIRWTRSRQFYRPLRGGG